MAFGDTALHNYRSEYSQYNKKEEWPGPLLMRESEVLTTSNRACPDLTLNYQRRSAGKICTQVQPHTR